MTYTYQTNLEMTKVSPITVRDYFSKNTFNMDIMTVLMHFRSIKQAMNYEARINSLNRKTVLQVPKTFAP